MKLPEAGDRPNTDQLVSNDWRDLVDRNRIISLGLKLADRLASPFNLKGETYLGSKLKRGMDLVLTVSTLPIWLSGIGLGIGVMRAESLTRPALITQRRYGWENQPFDMFKIRSQTVDTSAQGVVMPTRAGAILRKLSLDELPQMFNVLLGQMSLVGRRPIFQVDLDNLKRRVLVDLPFERAKEAYQFNDEQWRNGALSDAERADIESFADEVRSAHQWIYWDFAKNTGARPALTGLYQVLGRRQIPPEERAQLDLFYDQEASLPLDLAILLSTVPAVLSRRGAR